jgi:predicted glycosyltransferase
MPGPLSIVGYAVNGLGLGHLTRMTAVLVRMRWLLDACNRRHAMVVLTSSEADALAWHHGLAAIKVPSKSAAAAGRLPYAQYRAVARQVVWTALMANRPDLLLVDTFPDGAFGELPPAIDTIPHRVLIARRVQDHVASSAPYKAARSMFHTVLEPSEGEPPSADAIGIGPIHLHDTSSLLPTAVVRAELGIPEHHRVLYWSVGGGGDTSIDEAMHGARQMVECQRDITIILAAGPLYRGRSIGHPNIRLERGVGAMQLLAAAHLAVTAAGYNTVHECCALGIPMVLVPRARGADDQLARAHRMVQHGAGSLAASFAPQDVLHAMEAFANHDAYTAASHAAKTLSERNCALDAAAHALQRCVDAATLDRAMQLVETLRPSMVARGQWPQALRRAAAVWSCSPTLGVDDIVEQIREQNGEHSGNHEEFNHEV